jgi:TolA-binding protein
MSSMRVALILALLALPAAAAPPSSCGAADDYSRALCSYQHRNFTEAERGFRAIAEAGVKEPRTIKASYFLARTLMKTGRFDEAAKVFIRIYQTDKPFYDDWQCDFLLGECRKALGKG